MSTPSQDKNGGGLFSNIDKVIDRGMDKLMRRLSSWLTPPADLGKANRDVSSPAGHFSLDDMSVMIERSKAEHVGLPNKASGFGYVVRSYIRNSFKIESHAQVALVSSFYSLMDTKLSYPSVEQLGEGSGDFYYRGGGAPIAFGIPLFVGFPLNWRETAEKKRSDAIKLCKEICSNWNNEQHPLLVTIEGSELFGAWWEYNSYNITGAAERTTRDLESVLGNTTKIGSNIVVTSNLSVDLFKDFKVGGSPLVETEYEAITSVYELKF